MRLELRTLRQRGLVGCAARNLLVSPASRWAWSAARERSVDATSSRCSFESARRSRKLNSSSAGTPSAASLPRASLRLPACRSFRLSTAAFSKQKALLSPGDLTDAVALARLERAGLAEGAAGQLEPAVDDEGLAGHEHVGHDEVVDEGQPQLL